MWKGIVCILAFSGCVWMTGGLMCFQCLATSKDGECINDFKGLVNARQGNYGNGSEQYVKECQDGENYVHNNCAIEVYYGAVGTLTSFIRDCSDGKTFSFSKKDESNTHPKLRQIAANNSTTCVYEAGIHICVTLCEGDFCNGPVPPPNDTCNDTDNATCGAGGLFMGSGPFGPVVDRVLGRGYLVPLLVAILSVGILG